MMREISFTVLGGVGGESAEQGTVVDLLAAVPYLLTTQLVPPLRVVNDLLTKGSYDAGMSGGCEWEPFQIDASEWNDVKQALTAPGSEEPCEFIEPPDWVKTYDEWHTWVMTFKWGGGKGT